VKGGVAFTVGVEGGGGTITSAPTQTASTGSTSVGTWTLGTTVGPNTLRVQSAGLTPLTITVTAEPGLPATASSIGGPMTASGSVGGVSPLQPSIRISDAFGNPIPGRTISVSITGGGSVQNSSPVTNSAGVAVVGTWTLGPTAGEQSVALSAGGTAPAVVFRVTVEAGPPAVASAATQATSGVGTPGSQAPFVPAVRVADAFGNSIAGVVVSAVVAGGGTIGNASPATNAAGVATVGSWTLGPVGGSTNTVTITALNLPPVVFTVTTVATAYTVEIRYLGTPPTQAVQNAINNAVVKIQQIVVGDVADQPLNANVNGCIPGAGVISQVIDDIIVYVSIGADDGAGGRLASAGPCLPVRPAAPFLPYLGALDIDQADIASMTNNGTLESVLLHELMHALGYGTLWQPIANWPNSLLSGAGGPNPFFTGAQGRQAYVAAGGTSPAGVPVENTGGPGTRDSHWRMTVVGNELMVGFIAPGFRPVSAVTIQSVADLGYAVSLQFADPFNVIPPGQIRALSVEGQLRSLDDDIRPPRFIRDEFGVPIRLPPPIPLPPVPPRR
jgi:hypothetical protein